jgi:hypothetical protein
MRRPLLPCICASLVWGAVSLRASSAAAQPPWPLSIVKPELRTCVSPDALAIGLSHAAPLLPRFVPSQVLAIPADTALFRVDGSPERLRVRGFGLRAMLGGDGLEKWPLFDPEPVADVDELITGQSCDTVTEAVVAFIASVMAPVADVPHEAEHKPAGGGTTLGIAGALDLARRELAQRSELTAGVLSTELGLTLIVEDVNGTCRRGTWLDVHARQPQTGLSIGELERSVLTCLEDEGREQQEPARGIASPAAAPEQPRRHLPAASGALIAGLGMAVGIVALTQMPKPGPLLVYSAMPPVLGGLAGYVAPKRWRDALWLSGYWVGVAGTTLIAGLRGGEAKPVLIGGFLTAGAMGSAGLSLLSAATSENGGALPGSVGIPAAVGSGLAMLGLLVKGSGSSSFELATVGALAALAPAVWLQIAPSKGAADKAPLLGVGLDVDEQGAVLGLTGDL